MKLDRTYVERVYAGWIGKIMGVRHGAPVEGWSSADIERIFGELSGFVLDVDIFEPDDDINGPLFFLRALEDERADETITAEQMARAWTNYPPYEHGFFWWPGYGRPTSYHLLEQGRASMAPVGDPDVGLGPRIFVDTWGLVSPGNLPQAAQFARTALRANAVPGGAGEDATVLQACMIAAAFVETTPEAVLRAALAMIPAERDIARMAKDMLVQYHAHPDDWKATRERIVSAWSAPTFPGMFHAVSNTAYILLGLLHSKGDLRRGIEMCTQCGLDTDCNSGNLGVILGVLGGISAVDASMRRTMNDVVMSSSVLGEQNIGDIPTQAKWIALQGFRLAKQAAPAWLTPPSGRTLSLDFDLPGSTHGFRAETHADTCLRAVSEGEDNSLRLWCGAFDARTGLRLYHRTYYRPADVHNDRYEPCFSPKVYPGQTLHARVRAEDADGPALVASLFAYDDNAQTYLDGPTVHLSGAEWTTLTWQIPALDGACITKVGVRYTLVEAHPGGFTTRMGGLWAEGPADYALDFAKERMEWFSFSHHECSQFTYSRGSWHYSGKRLEGQVAAFGEVITGHRAFTDYAVAATLIPQTASGARLLFRVQGAHRYYAAALVEGGLHLIRENHGETPLASAPFVWQVGQPVRLRAEAQGTSLRVYADDKLLLEAEDDLLDSGCIGFGLKGPCAAAQFEALEMRPLKG